MPAPCEETVAVIGGGLAGMSAAAALARHGVPVVLYEARRRTGGRAGSFLDARSNTEVDYCQHVAMGCCTNLLALLRSADLLDLWQRHDRLRFLDPEGRTSLFTADPLPAPLHLARSLLTARFLSIGERIAVASGLLRLMRFRAEDSDRWPSFQDWLAAHGQTPATICRFWQPIIESALGESAREVAVTAARKVFIDGFAAHRDAFHLYVPTQPLSQLFGEALPQWLRQQGVDVRCGSSVQDIRSAEGHVQVTVGGSAKAFRYAIVAVPWHQLPRVAGDSCGLTTDQRHAVGAFPASSIAGIHLWFDGPITDLPHVVFVDRFCQWLFAADHDARRGNRTGEAAEHYYQVVISNADEVQRMSRGEVASRVANELREAFPDAAAARLLRYRIVTDPLAVFSVSPAVERQRPLPRTADPRVFLAGDYTATGWPATMEGAVISGARAAEAVLAAVGRPHSCLVPPQSRGWLARLLIAP